jgi:hypothetical protein
MKTTKMMMNMMEKVCFPNLNFPPLAIMLFFVICYGVLAFNTHAALVPPVSQMTTKRMTAITTMTRRRKRSLRKAARAAKGARKRLQRQVLTTLTNLSSLLSIKPILLISRLEQHRLPAPAICGACRTRMTTRRTRKGGPMRSRPRSKSHPAMGQKAAPISRRSASSSKVRKGTRVA